MKTATKKVTNIFGVKPSIIKAIHDIIFLNDKIEKTIIFGSRAKGNFKKGSDIDIAIIANELSFEELLEIKSKINELPIPYKVDIIDFNKLKNHNLIEHIKRVGKILVRNKSL